MEVKAEERKEQKTKPNGVGQNLSSNNIIKECSYTIDATSDGTDTYVSTITSAEPQPSKSQLQPTFFGRYAERELLQQAYQNMVNSPSNERKTEGQNVVLVSGRGGVGKTSLVEFSLREYVSLSGGYFCMGSFSSTWEEPYGGIVAAVGDLVDLHQQADPDWWSKVKSELGSELHFLRTILPSVGISDPCTMYDGGKEDFVGAAKLNQCHSVCWRFLQCAAAETPIVLFVDDIQYADSATMQLLNSLLRSKISSSILWVFTLQTDALKEPDHMLDRLLEEMTMTRDTCKIALDNLGEGETLQFLVKLTGLTMDDGALYQLTDVVYKRTNGNIMDILQFYKFLVDEEMATWDSNVEGKIRIDFDRILSETHVSDSLAASILETRILDLGQNSISVLGLAALLGRTFSLEILDAALHFDATCGTIFRSIDATNFYRPPPDSVGGGASIDQVVFRAVQQGFLERLNTEQRYKFAHQTIQDCFKAFIPPQALPYLHLQIGLAAQGRPLRQDQEWLMFLAGHHLNCGSSLLSDRDDRITLAKLNLCIAKVACSKAAFSSADTFLALGLKLTKKDKNQQSWWEDEYDFMLELHSLSAEVKSVLGEFKSCHKLAEQVLRHRQNTVDSKRAILTWMDALAAEGRLEDAIAAGTMALDELGLPLLPNQRRCTILPALAREWTKAMADLRGMTDDELLNLPSCTDIVQIAACEILNQLASFVFQTIKTEADGRLLSLVGLRMLRIGLKHGLHPRLSCFVFAGHAVVMHMMGFREKSWRFANLSLQMMKGLLCEDARTIVILNHLVLTWRQPIADSLQEFERAYHLALGSGDVPFAFQAYAGILTAMIHSGAPLEEIEMRARQLSEEALLLNQSNARRHALPMWQMALNLLREDCEDPVSLTGEAMVESELISEMNSTNNQLGLTILSFIKLKLAYLFEDWTTVVSMMKRVDQRRNPLRGHYTQPICETYIGLCNYALARLLPMNFRYRTRARRATVALRHWMRRGVANICLLYSILKAQRMIVRNDIDGAVNQLERCILEAQTDSFLHWEAIISEMLMRVLHESAGNVASSFHYFQKAKSLYGKWGAHVKVSWLDQFYYEIGSRDIEADGEAPSEQFTPA